MSRFGVRKYSDPGFVYGDSSGFSSLSVAPFTATAVDYDRVNLSWLAPTGSYNRIRLVRNQNGVSDTAEDGLILLDESFPATVRQTRGFTDAYDSVAATVPYVNLVTGKYAYYSIWLYLTTDNVWYQAGNASTLIADRHETLLSSYDGSPTIAGRTRSTHEKVMDLLPRVFTSSSANAVDEVDQNSALYNFLYGFSYTIDEFLTFIDLLAPNADMTNLPPQLLTAKSVELALTTDNRASTRFQRQLVREARWMYARKGTAAALSDFVESMTGYNTTCVASPNLMLSNQDSTFYDWQSYGDWLTANSATVTGIPTADGTHVTFSAVNNFSVGEVVSINGIIPASYNLQNVTVTSSTTAHFTVESNVTGAWVSGGTVQKATASTYSFWRTVGNISMTSANTVTPPSGELRAIDLSNTAKVVVSSPNAKITLGEDAPITRGIPVQPSTLYALSFYQQGTTTTHITPNLLWYDVYGNSISTTAGTAAFATTAFGRVLLSATSPANAAYAALELVFDATGTFYLDMFQFSLAYTVTAAVGASGTVTYTVAGAPFPKGRVITVSGLGVASGASLNLSNQQVVSATATQITVANAAVGTASGTGILTAAFHEAGGVNVVIQPNKINSLTNPSFEAATANVPNGWTYTGVTSALQSAITTGNPGPVNTGSGNNLLRVTPSGSGPAVITATGTVPADVVNGSFYTFSVFGRLPGTSADVTLGLSASASGAATISNTQTYSTLGAVTGALSDGAHTTYLTTYPVTPGDLVSVSGMTPASLNIANAVVTSTSGLGFTVASAATDTYVSGGTVSFPLANRLQDGWSRFSVTIYTPYGYSVNPVTLTPTVSYSGGAVSLWDAAQLEPTFAPTDYFDGSYVDAGWGLGLSNANNSDSFMYQNFTAKIPRLADEVASFLPSGTPYTVLRSDGVATTISGAAVRGITP